jgi:fucose permease
MKKGVVLLMLAYVGFVSLGLPDGLLGVAWPSMRASFGLRLDALGPLLVATTSGYVLASFASGWVLARINVGSLLALSCLATGASLLGYAGAPSFAVVIGFGVFAGLGAGAIDAGLNTYVATNHGPRTVSWLHACYGVGAALGPAIMTRVLAHDLPWQRGYLLVACAQIALAAAFGATASHWPGAGEPDAASGPVASNASARETLRLPAALLGVLTFFVYTGIEATAGAWSYSLLTQARGLSMAAAGFWVSAFWVGLTFGRIASGAIARSLDAASLLAVSLALTGTGAALLWLAPWPELAASGLALLGLGAGPIFPTLIASTPARVGLAHVGNAVGFQIAAAAFGQSLLPWLVGGLASALGLEIVGPALFAPLALLAAICELTRRARWAPAEGVLLGSRAS